MKFCRFWQHLPDGNEQLSLKCAIKDDAEENQRSDKKRSCSWLPLLSGAARTASNMVFRSNSHGGHTLSVREGSGCTFASHLWMF
jgi:hypothetical protein